MKDYRLTVKVRNNRILKAIEETGGSPGLKWCDDNGLSYCQTNDLINMTRGPLNDEGKLYPIAEKLCDVLGKSPDELWSNEQLYPLEKNFSEMEMDHDQIVALMPPENQYYLPDFSELEQEQARALLSSAIGTLTGIEQKVIKMRFYDELTLEQCGEKLNVSRQRVLEIENKALRKLRHPSISGKLIDAIDMKNYPSAHVTK